MPAFFSAASRRQVDGLRITDEATLAVVVSVLAGTINTRLVAATPFVASAATSRVLIVPASTLTTTASVRLRR